MSHYQQRNWQCLGTDALEFELHLQLAQLPNKLHFCKPALVFADADADTHTLLMQMNP
jgi:hypothetical protein